MKAMILAAGHGTRMRPLTDNTPKPLLKVGGKALIVWHIEKLKRCGFEDIVINIAYLGEQIPKALGDGSQWGVSIQYSDEQKEGALETAGGIIKALPLLGTEPFLVISADVWSDYDYAMPQFKANELAHLILIPNPAHNPDGDFHLDPQGYLHRNGNNKLTFSGIAYYHPELFTGLSYGKRPIRYVLRNAIDQHQVSGEKYTGDWRDIGTPERLKELEDYLEAERGE